MDHPKKTFRIARDTYFSLGASLGAVFSESILRGGYGGNVFYFAPRCLSGRLSGEIFPRRVFSSIWWSTLYTGLLQILEKTPLGKTSPEGLPERHLKAKVEYISPITASEDPL